MEKYFTWSLIVLLCALLVAAKNPGFKARITSKGLKYANDQAIQALTANVKTLVIPDQHDKASGVDFWVKNIRVTKFNPPASTISIAPGQGLTWKAANAAIAIHGDFRYKWKFISDSGSFDADISGVSFNLGIDIGADSGGRPTISARQCASSIGNVDFHFHGGRASIYNLFRGKVGDLIKKMLQGQLCTLINNEINVDGKKKLEKLQVTTPLAKKFLLDYRLVQTPSFQSQFMETYHKGEIYWLTEPSTESPLVPPVMPETNDTQSMLYFWLSDYLFDTTASVAQKHGFLVYNMSQKDLPPDSRGVLNTSCDGFIPKCIGKLIPQIGQKYPNSNVELRMKSAIVPKMNIDSSGVSMKFGGLIDLYARKPGTSDTPFLLTLNATMSTTVNLNIQNELLYGSIKDLNLKLKVVNSAVGPIQEAFLDFLINEALKAYLIPQLNDLGKKGFPLPVTDEIKFVNTKLSFAKDTLMISTDLKYTPPSLNLEDNLTDTLKYQPRVRAHMNVL